MDEELRRRRRRARPRRSAERLGRVAGDLPDALTSVLTVWREAGEVMLSRRLGVAEGGGASQVHISSVSGIPAVRGILCLREEVRWDDRLYTAIHERYGLSRHTLQLGLLVREGLTNREIAREDRPSEATVKVYFHHLYRACRVRSRTALVALMDRMKESG